VKKPSGRIASALVAGVVITLGVSSTATAQVNPPTPGKAYQDNVGHGYVGTNGDGVLVIACAAGAPSNVATANLSVTAGPDQDGADNRLWNYEVRVVGDFHGPTSKFSWTCGGKPGEGVVDFKQPPTTPPSTTTPSTTTPSTSTTVPSTTAPTTSKTTTAAPSAKPKPQVKFVPQGGVETGFGGTAQG